MAKIIINIPDAEYNYFMSDECFDADDGFDAIEYICNGTPLPKGHGRLKDVDWIDDNCPNYRTEDGAWCYTWEDINNAPTIIEADKAESGADNGTC